jgi:hypothetical protein
VPANTQMDVLRYERDLAALTPDGQITPLTVAGISPDFQNGYIGTWTAGIEQQLRGVTFNAAYVGTAGVKLPVMDFPNGFTGAEPGYAPYAQFDSAGRVTGGFGQMTIVTNRSHSTYHGLQLSAQNTLGHLGMGFQASYTLAKSIDDTSAVLGNQTAPQDPFHTRADKGPSSFDIRQAASFSLFQDLHHGFQVLGIGTFLSGLPFTVFSGVQQTGVGSNGTDRPDQVGVPELSTGRTVREDYFGRGLENPAYFRIPRGRFGALGRNTFRGPGLRNFDLALIKDTVLLRRSDAERATLQFRTEVFNVFNLVNFGLPSNIVLGPGFGQISRTAATSRQIQFSVKIIY